MGTPAKFQTRRQSIEAVQFDGTKECAKYIEIWSNGIVEDVGDFPMPRMAVDTPDGRCVALQTDWICRDEGGFWVCSDEIFQRKYEAV